MRLIFSPKAAFDIDQIFGYTEGRWGSEKAEDYIFGLRDKCRALSAGGIRGRSMDSIRSGYYLLPYASHFIVYRESAKSVTIVRILHQRMNIAAHL